MIPQPTERWDRRFLELASLIGGWSKDRSAGTGCVIVGSDRLLRSSGYNGFVRGIDDNIAERHERPAKYSWTEHAERNAIYNAARLGISLEGCTAYVNWFPCIDCARALVQAGIVRLVGLESNHLDSRWGAEFTFATEMLRESGVEIKLYDFPDLAARR
ncbi:dCMP deaminase family protein [Enhydrobacter sp.]|uniref:deoxycytidylate deaminase n=1 Tax=Enhydrobacter sp. TaxID=1894999 RepID=UPI00261CC4D9|nr:dCMP deaminase family protein [Enhydrobacter sp.]